jgi:hypothetical protein
LGMRSQLKVPISFRKLPTQEYRKIHIILR